MNLVLDDHAAALHTVRMKMKPFTGMMPVLRFYFHISSPCGCAAHGWHENGPAGAVREPSLPSVGYFHISDGREQLGIFCGLAGRDTDAVG